MSSGSVDASVVWVTIGALAVVTVAIKGAGPFLLGRRDLPERWQPAVTLLPTALMTALVTVAVVVAGEDGGLDVDLALLAGLGAAAVLLVLRVPLAAVMVAAVVVTAVVRHLA